MMGQDRLAKCVRFGEYAKPGSACSANTVCRCVRASSPDLAFFYDRGPTSRFANDTCRCGYANDAHTLESLAKPHMHNMRSVCHGDFVARGPAPFDEFNCGCGGWS